jgi:hypothetical protein
MSDSFDKKLTLIVLTVPWARAPELDFPRRSATGWLRDAASHKMVTAVFKRKDFE